jgi:L-amino acid N-acyltransferase YncA/isopentenyldiphosphate isomerase
MINADYTFRSAEEEDAAELLEIYAPYVINTAVSFEYDVPSTEEFRSRIHTTLQHYPYIVAVNRDGRIDGYVYASPFHERSAYEHCAELSIYIRESCRGIGLGSALYEQIEGKLRQQGILNIYACIASTPRTNDSHLTNKSPLFHAKCGFKTVAHFNQCGCKFGLWYDMIYMEKIIGTDTDKSKTETEPEKWDIYDVNRQPTGRTMRRGSVNRPGDYHIVVHVCMFNSDGRMLIQQRAHDKAGWPDKWDVTIGGHVVAGETSRQGAERELREELGIDTALAEAPCFTITFSDGFDDYYLIEKDVNPDAVTMQKEEVQNVKYASKEEIKKMISDGSFIDYHDGLVDLLYAMKVCRGAHASSGTNTAQKA